MPQTWKTANAGRFNCPHCGALYNKNVTRLPSRDKDTAQCFECKNEMDKWDSTRVPSYELVKKSD